MNAQEKFDKFLTKNPHPHVAFFNRPHLSRRRFFEVLGAGVTGSYLVQRAGLGANTVVTPQLPESPKGTAKNVIFILLAGAPSHVDTFDFKMTNGVTPAAAAPETINGILWPTGILPNLAKNINDFTLVRSMSSHALVHSLGQTWTQIGRNPAAALGNIAPNIGSIVAAEKFAQRKPTDIFPTFLALNSNGAVNQGYLSGKYAPFKVQANAAGISNTTNATGQTRFENRFKLLNSLDSSLRTAGPNGVQMEDYNEYYIDAKQLMYNPTVNQYFGYPAAESTRYGATGTGNAMLVASQVLKANLGTRFIQITSNDGWDMHSSI